jgi:hypothetical protein
MSSANSAKRFLPILGGILILALMAGAAIKSQMAAYFIDPYGLLFILLGGVALMMISNSRAEIWRALRHAAGSPGNDAEIRLSAFFWEAAARGFWMLGGLRSVLNSMIAFMDMANDGGIRDILNGVVRSLAAMFYGLLAAVICFIPYWRLTGKLQHRPLLSGSEQSEAPTSIWLPGMKWHTVIGYILFSLVLILTTPNLGRLIYHLTAYSRPALMVVLGGVLVLMLFAGVVNLERLPSISFAVMGLVGSLMASIQVLFGIDYTKILVLAEGIYSILCSCAIALLGMILVGAPWEDRAIRGGRFAAPFALSRVAWYAFPLFALLLVFLAAYLSATPFPRIRP